MEYEQIRPRIRTGDVMLVEGRGFLGKLIRILTAQQISHVGLLLVEETGVWVAEMQGSTGGYRLVPASQWTVEAGSDTVYWGIAPAIVHLSEDTVKEAAYSYRGRPYSYWTLVSTWFSQLLMRKTPASLVCSTFVQRCWEEAGYDKFKQTADPGDILRHCVSAGRLDLG